jgi:hypothetical protein
VLPLLIDDSIRRGTDVLKAIALRHTGCVVECGARASHRLKREPACRALMCEHDKSRLLLERKRVLPMKNASQCCIQALPFAPRGVLEK